MKTLERQLADYGTRQRELHGPIDPSELKSIIEGDSEPTEKAFRIARVRSGSPSRMLPRWLAGVAVAMATLLGFGLIGLYIGIGRPPDGEGTRGGLSQVNRRSVNVEGVSLSFDLPASGWESDDDLLLSKDFQGDDEADAVIFFTAFPDGADFQFCRDLLPSQLSENSDIDMVAESFSSGSPAPFGGVSDYTVGGLEARVVEVVVRGGGGCDPGFFYSWTPQPDGASWKESKTGDIIDAWFVKVDGVVLAIVAETRVSAVIEAKPEIFHLVDSIRFPSITPIATADYVIDLNTGEMTLLPAAIRSSAPFQYAVSPDGTRLAYVAADGDGSFQLFTAGIDGSDIHQVTQPPAEATSPAWSPDGSLVAFVESGGLFLLDVATAESTQIPNVVAGWATQFTPDGSSILYDTRSESGESELRIVPIDGGSSVPFIGPEQGVSAAGGALSPDGSLVTFLGHRINGPGGLRFIADTDDRKPQQLGQLDTGDCGGSSSAGTWSPDGTRIACSGQGDHVIVVEVATGEATHVAEGKGAIWLDDHTLLVEAWGK